MRFLFLVFTFLLIPFYSFPQNKAIIDSLKSAYQTASHYTTKAKLLVELSELLYLQYEDTILPLCQKAIKIVNENIPQANPEEKCSFLHTKAKALNNIGFIYQRTGNEGKAMEFYTESVAIYEKLLDEKSDYKAVLNKLKSIKMGLAESYFNLGYIFKTQGEIEKALEYYFLSLKIQEEVRHKAGMAYSYQNIGAIYSNLGEMDPDNYREALEYYFLSLKIREQINDRRGMSHSYNAIGSTYYQQGDIDPDNYQKAMEYYLRSFKIHEEIKDKFGLAGSNHNIGNTLCKLDSMNKGMQFLISGLKIEREIGHKAGVSVNNATIGNWQLKMAAVSIGSKSTKLVEEALESGQEALVVAREIGHVGYIRRAANLLSKVYRIQNNWGAALGMYELEIQMRDSILNEENTKATIRQQMKYEYEKAEIIKENEEKEKARIEAEVTSRRDTLHYTAIFIGLLLVFGLVLTLGFVKVNPKTAEAIIFISFLIVFEFLLILADPYIEDWSGGAPGWKLLFNAVLAGLMFPLHQFFEGRLKKRLIKVERNKWSKGVKVLMFLGLVLSHSFLFAIPDTRQVQTDTTQSPNQFDSLKTAYQSTAHDTIKVTKLIALGEDIYLKNPDEARQLFIQAGEIAQTALTMKSELSSREVKVLNENLAAALNNTGLMYGYQGNIEMALDYYTRSLNLYEHVANQEGTAMALNNIAGLYNGQGEIQIALEYFHESLKIREAINDDYGIAMSLNNIGLIYQDNGQLDKGLEYNFRSLKIREKINDKIGISTSMNNIAGIYVFRGNIEEALIYYNRSLSIREEIGDEMGVCITLNNLGELSLNESKINQAMIYGKRSLKIAEKLGYPDEIKNSGFLLHRIYKFKGNWEEALNMYELFIVMRDSINNEKTHKATIRQLMKYEHEKEQIIKEQQEIEQARIQAEVTSRRDNLHYSAIFIGILILFGGVLMLGFVKVRPKDVEGIIFISFLILFEFVLVLADPHIEQYTGGAPGYKLLFNAGIAGLMFPLHQFFEGKLKKRIVKAQRLKLKKRMEQYKKDVEEL